MSVRVTQTARSTPTETIEGIEEVLETQTMVERLWSLFRYIEKEPTGFTNKYLDSEITFSDVGKSFTISPLIGSSFEYYIRAKRYTVSAPQTFILPTVVNPADNEGMWYFYFTDAGLQGSKTPWDLSAALAPISNGYWDSTNQKWIRENEERHGLNMSSDTHKNMHVADGSKVGKDALELAMANFTVTGDGTSNTHAQFGITDGSFLDEDILINIIHANTPVNHFEQYLRPYAQLPGFYLNGTDYWRRKSATSFPIYNNVTGTCSYNYWNGSSWELRQCTDGYFFATWLIYTDDIHEPVIWVLGQREDPDLISAIDNNTRYGNPFSGTPGLQIPRRFSEEFYFYKKLIWETKTTFTNTPRAALRYITTTEVSQFNDRYAVICTYNGNAGTGKYLEFFPGQTSDTNPFTIPEPSYMRTLTLSATANSTGTLSFYKESAPTVPIFDVSLSNSKYTVKTLSYQLSKYDRLIGKISSGSINKPACTLFVQTGI